MENYGSIVEEQQYSSHGFSDLDLPLTLGFSDISLSGLLDPQPLLACRDCKKQIGSGSSDRLADYCAVEVPDDPNTEVIEPPTKRRNQTAQTHSLTEKRRRDKIKAKMKVLQGLIPNSEKLDRASLLEKVISHIKTLQWQLQIMQGMKLYPYFPHLLQYAGATQLSLCVPPIPSNMGFGTGPSDNMSSQPHFAFGIPYSPPFCRSANYGPMPYQTPNPYFQQQAHSTFMHTQFPQIAPQLSSFP